MMSIEDLNILIEEHNNIVKASDFKQKRNDLDRDYPEILRVYEIKRIIFNETHINDDSKTGLLPILEEYEPLQQRKPSLSTQITNNQISMDVKEILQQCRIEGTIVKLPNVQLDRKLYQEVAKSFELIGGKWKGGKVFGFVFNNDPFELLEQIANGEKRNLKKEFQFFATPSDLADKLVYLADLKQHDTILEPSAGQGAIIKAINKVCDVTPDCFELMRENVIILNKSGLKFNLIGDDFFKHNGKSYSKIIANPPFSKNQDIDHLKEMYECLARGGRLVCITSESWVYGSQKKQIEFKNWLDDVKAEIIDIERGSFKKSGTMVGGKIVIINKEL